MMPGTTKVCPCTRFRIPLIMAQFVMGENVCVYVCVCARAFNLFITAFTAGSLTLATLGLQTSLMCGLLFFWISGLHDRKWKLRNEKSVYAREAPMYPNTLNRKPRNDSRAARPSYVPSARRQKTRGSLHEFRHDWCDSPLNNITICGTQESPFGSRHGEQNFGSHTYTPRPTKRKSFQMKQGPSMMDSNYEVFKGRYVYDWNDQVTEGEQWALENMVSLPLPSVVKRWLADIPCLIPCFMEEMLPHLP